MSKRVRVAYHEGLCIVSRSGPMLGLVATMIPMGPALFVLGRGDGASIGEKLVVAFAGATPALSAASIAHYVLTVRRRWFCRTSVRSSVEEAAFRKRQEDLEAARSAAQSAYVQKRKAATAAVVETRTAYRKAGGTD